jgi:GNAT superfamily N-acetyltransferase
MALKANCYVIKARHEEHGRHMRGAMPAQYAIAALHAAGELPQSPPHKIVTSATLIRLVRKLLKQHPEYRKLGLGQLDRKTILSAADDQGIKYRPVGRGRPRKSPSENGN